MIRIIQIILLFSFFTQQIIPYGYADAVKHSLIPQLPAPQGIVTLSKPYQPLNIQGLTVNPKNPLAFNFIVDAGQTK